MQGFKNSLQIYMYF